MYRCDATGLTRLGFIGAGGASSGTFSIDAVNATNAFPPPDPQFVGEPLQLTVVP